MKILEKIAAKNGDIYGAKPVTIVFFGDSVTQGCFEAYKKGERVETAFDQEQAYSVKVKKILNYLYPSAQVNIINSGISGDNAVNGSKRFARDVAPYAPDLVVVGFALNDSTRGESGKGAYAQALSEIFEKTKALGAECILLTPNMMNDRVSPHIHDEFIKGLANTFMKVALQEYVELAKATAKAHGVPVCDVYDTWRQMQAYGVDITELLANKLNHPTREMHWLIAYQLLQTMMKA